jgi:hypothetical protein
MSGPKRNPDSLNTIGVVVVGICGAVMVYVSITALQAFYMNDTSELQTMADYGGQDTTAKSHKAEEMRNINEPQLGNTPSITIDKAMDLVIKDTKEGKPVVPAVQVGANGQAFKPKATEAAHGGAPEVLVTTPPPAPAAAGSGAGSGADCDEVSCVLNNYAGACCEKFHHGGGSGAGSAAVQLHGTGSPADKAQPVPGAGGAPTGGQGSAQRLVPNTGSGGHAR